MLTKRHKIFVTGFTKHNIRECLLWGLLFLPSNQDIFGSVNLVTVVSLEVV